MSSSRRKVNVNHFKVRCSHKVFRIIRLNITVYIYVNSCNNYILLNNRKMWARETLETSIIKIKCGRNKQYKFHRLLGGKEFYQDSPCLETNSGRFSIVKETKIRACHTQTTEIQKSQPNIIKGSWKKKRVKHFYGRLFSFIWKVIWVGNNFFVGCWEECFSI